MNDILILGLCYFNAVDAEKSSADSGFQKHKVSGILERNIGLLQQLTSQEPFADDHLEKVELPHGNELV